MGLLFSRFRKKKTTIQTLDEIEQKIKSIEKFHKETEQRFRRVVGKLIVSSILVYAIALCGYYYYFSPDTFRENIINFVPLLVFPIAIIMSRRILSWYYRRKLSKNETALKGLKTNKKKILDEVMEKEIYKVAKEILEKYAPEQLNSNFGKSITTNGNSKQLVLTSQTLRADSVARQRMTSATVSRRFDSSTPTPTPSTPGGIVPCNAGLAQPRLSLPRPILPRNRGAFDKLVDVIIGDGPGNRYALICRMCSSHNGMALKHEFEFLSFRCAYCMQWNPARKQKPHAPNLVSGSGSHDESDNNNSEPEVTENANISVESQKIGGMGDTAEMKAAEETVESELLDTSKSDETPGSNDVEETPATDGEVEDIVDDDEDVQIPSLSDGVDLSDVRKALEELETDDAVSARFEHLDSATPDKSVDSDSR